MKRMASAKHKEGLEYRIASLPRLGWKRDGNDWINPRSGRRCTTEGALDIEDVRGTFQKEKMVAYNAKRPSRGKRGRPPKLKLAA